MEVWLWLSIFVLHEANSCLGTQFGFSVSCCPKAYLNYSLQWSYNSSGTLGQKCQYREECESFLIHHSSDDLHPHHSSDEMVGLSGVVCVHVLLTMIWVGSTRKKVVSSSEYRVRARQGKV